MYFCSVRTWACILLVLVGCDDVGTTVSAVVPVTVKSEGQTDVRKHKELVFVEGSFESQHVRVPFNIHNTSSDRPLKILGTTASCACSKIEVTNKEVLPEQDTTLWLSMYLHGNATKRSMACSVKTNDTANPIKYFSATLQVLPRIEVSETPFTLRIDGDEDIVRKRFTATRRSTSRDEELTLHVDVKGNSNGNVSVRQLGYQDEAFNGSYMQRVFDYEFVAPRADIAQTDGAAILISESKSSSNDSLKVHVPIRCIGARKIAASPSVAVLSFSERKPEQIAQVELKSTSDYPFDVTSVVADGTEHLTIESSMLTPFDWRLHVRGTLRDGSRSRMVAKVIVEYTIGETRGTLSIPVVFLNRSRQVPESG